LRVSEIFVYPIKSCGGISVSASDVVERGLAFDRRYMLIDGSGRFVSQREARRLCQVQVAFANDELRVVGPGISPLTLPLRAEPDGLSSVKYQLWSSVGEAVKLPDGSRWFSEVIGSDVSLVYMPEEERRAVNPARARPGDIVSFADGYPLLVISEASLADLNRRLPEPVSMRNFRPNLVLSGAAPYAEDAFGRVRIGPVWFRGVKRCERCVVTTLHPDSGAASKEPLRTLATYRQGAGKVWFGMNLVHEGRGRVQVGDEARSEG
jgi:uncharacterized protein YcbX